MPTSDQIVTAKIVLQAHLELQRLGINKAMTLLENTEPDLTEVLAGNQYFAVPPNPRRWGQRQAGPADSRPIAHAASGVHSLAAEGPRHFMAAGNGRSSSHPTQSTARTPGCAWFVTTWFQQAFHKRRKTMGYTHYWRRAPELPAGTFAAAVNDCQKALPHTGIALAGPLGRGRPVFGPAVIAFNGPGKAGLETFRIDTAETRGKSPELHFCKTNHQPYDLCVQIALIVFAHHFGEAFQVSSDGAEADWASARRLCQEQLGYGDDFRPGR